MKNVCFLQEVDVNFMLVINVFVIVVVVVVGSLWMKNEWLVLNV